MAWSDETQHGFAGFGFNLECGQATLDTGAVEVPTRLTKIFAALVTPIDPAAETAVCCDGVITEGAVTISDSVVANAAMSVSYLFIGL